VQIRAFCTCTGSSERGQVDTRTITNGSNNPGIRYIYLNP
jgi:hypothetical protein